MAAKLVTFRQGDNQHTPIGGTTQSKAAAAFNASKRSVQRGCVVLNEGSAEEIRAVELGELPVSVAADRITQRKQVDPKKRRRRRRMSTRTAMKKLTDFIESEVKQYCGQILNRGTRDLKEKALDKLQQLQGIIGEEIARLSEGMS